MISLTNVHKCYCIILHPAYSPDREDFSSDVITVTFPADETGTQINDMPAPIVIFEDEINEALEEVFIVVLTLQSSTDPGSVIITRVSSLCRIIDNDSSCVLKKLFKIKTLYRIINIYIKGIPLSA